MIKKVAEKFSFHNTFQQIKKWGFLIGIILSTLSILGILSGIFITWGTKAQALTNIENSVSECKIILSEHLEKNSQETIVVNRHDVEIQLLKNNLDGISNRLDSIYTILLNQNKGR